MVEQKTCFKNFLLFSSISAFLFIAAFFVPAVSVAFLKASIFDILNVADKSIFILIPVVSFFVFFFNAFKAFNNPEQTNEERTDKIQKIKIMVILCRVFLILSIIAMIIFALAIVVSEKQFRSLVIQVLTSPALFLFAFSAFFGYSTISGQNHFEKKTFSDKSPRIISSALNQNQENKIPSNVVETYNSNKTIEEKNEKLEMDDFQTMKEVSEAADKFIEKSKSVLEFANKTLKEKTETFKSGQFTEELKQQTAKIKTKADEIFQENLKKLDKKIQTMIKDNSTNSNDSKKTQSESKEIVEYASIQELNEK